MDIDKIIYFVQFIPFIWFLLLDEEVSNKKSVFLKFIFISIAILIFGIFYEYNLAENNKSLIYYGSQMTLIFLLLYKIVQIPYYWIFKRKPEISTIPEKNIDIIPLLFVIAGTISLPFLIDIFIIQKLR
ncbi:hypothetical protein [uncultured Kordia sp.]|uniref:hypothetical protein n=1 Tax=uncultured Kordia sp. TaxID=507699 RepID=UPI00261DE8A0|nr:hypothetical protein [uncultured Kordia sp.]